MDFFSKLKRAFGFPDDGSGYDDELRVDSRNTPYVNPFRRDNNNMPAQESEQPTPTQPAATEADVAALKAQMQQLLSMMRNMQKSSKQPGAEAPAAVVAGGDDADLRQRLQHSETQRRAALNRANSLSEKIEELQIKVTTLENDKKGLLNKIRVMQVKAGGDGGTDTTNAIEKMMEQHHEDLAEKDQQISQLKKQLDQAQQQAEAVIRLEDQLNQAKAKIEAEAKELTTAQEQVRQQSERIKQLEEELQEANANLQIAEQVQQKLEEVEQFKEKKNAEIAKLRTQVEQLSGDENYRPKFEEAERENAALRKTIDQLNTLAKDTAEKHKRRDIDVANHIDALKAQLASAATVVERHRAEREQLEHQMARLKTEAEKSQDVIKAKEGELAEALASLTVANAQSEQLREEVEQLRNELEQLHQQTPVYQSEEEPIEQEQSLPSKMEEDEQSVETTYVSLNPFTAIEQDLDDIDWLVPAVPDKPVVVQPEPEPQPEPAYSADPRQLSLF